MIRNTRARRRDSRFVVDVELDQEEVDLLDRQQRGETIREELPETGGTDVVNFSSLSG